MTDKMAMLHAEISGKLNEISDLFDLKDTPKITLVIRMPELKDGGVLMGNDDFDAAITEIQRLRAKQPIVP
jgi:hypothetical protein